MSVAFDVMRRRKGFGAFDPNWEPADEGLAWPADDIIVTTTTDRRPSVPSIVEPPPGGYPRIIVHPERPNAAFAFISDGWYRSPTGEVVSYKTVADYVLTAKGVDQLSLMRALGQVPGSASGLSVWGVAAVAVGLGLLLLRR